MNRKRTPDMKCPHCKLAPESIKQADLSDVFFNTHTEGSAKYGSLWLTANEAAVIALTKLGVPYDSPLMRAAATQITLKILDAVIRIKNNA